VSDLEELDPRSREYQAVASIVAAVAKSTNRTSRWNQRILVDPDPRPSEAGLAHADGTMTLSEAKVLAPLRAAFDARQSGTALDADSLHALRDATATAVHESTHLIDRDGVAPDGHPVCDPPAIALDEGLVEQWTHDNLDDVLYEAGLDGDLPDLTGHVSKNAYPAYTAATRGLLDGIAPLTGRTPDELGTELMATDRSQRWNQLAGLAIAHDLHGDATAEDRDDLADTLRLQFSRAQEIQHSAQLDSEAKKQQGWHVGRGTASLLELELDRIRTTQERERAAAPQTATPDHELHRLVGLLRTQSAPSPRFARDTADRSGPAAAPPGLGPPNRRSPHLTRARPSEPGRGVSRA
jgi:hypothetical protein